MSWTNQQMDAINAKNRSIIVSAAAGSGKTSVLVERLIRIISDKDNAVPVEKMIVVTFTNAAAAEMKQRLSSALTAKLEKTPSDRWLSRQHALLGLASISTIHSFCFNLIRDNITKISLSSDFRILDTSEEKIYTDLVLQKLIEDMYDEFPKYMKLLCDNFCGNNDTPIIELIAELYSNISSIPFYECWLKKLDKIYDSNLYINTLLDNIKNKLSNCRDNIENMISTASSLDEIKLSEVLDDDMSILMKSEEYFNHQQYPKMLEYISSVRFKNFPASKKNVIYPEERGFIKDIRNSTKTTFKSISEYKNLIIYLEDDLERHKQIMKILSFMITEYDKRLFDMKVKKNAIGFDDAEQIVLKLLGEINEEGNIVRTPLGDEISEKYELIMVDEFQDSNDRQDMIFRLLSRNGNANNYGNNLFFVGDVKQSIYRFRQANPDNFINVQKSFSPYKENENKNAYIKLNRNFRSSPQVIDFVNYIFKNIMSEYAGDIDYNEEHYLINGASFSKGKRDTQILLIDKSAHTDDCEAMCIASKIKSMIDKNTPVSINNGNGSRPCEMKDFCILLRNKKMNETYAGCLRKYGLEVNCEDVTGYLESREISVLINLLRILDNPLLDIPMASVMMSPMFMFSADEVAEIRIVDKKSKLYSNICKILGKDENESHYDEDSVLYKKSLSLYELICELRLLAAFSTLPEMIQAIYDRTDFTSVIHLYKDADRKKANLRMLLEYANKFETGIGGGIGSFIKYIDKIIETKGDFQSGGSTASMKNAVTVTTMHKSKGLEFPFVFVAETDTKFSMQDQKKVYQFSTELGIGFKLQNKEKYERFKTAPYESINNYNKIKALGEEMRIMYVALTRAKEQLFITLDISESNTKKAQEYARNIHKSNGITPSLSRSVNSMNDWILMTLISHRKAAKLREIFGIYENYVNKEDFPISFIETAPEDKTDEIINSTEDINRELDKKIINKLHDAFKFQYDMSLVPVASKLSVSDISKHNDNQPLILKHPRFVDNEELSAAEKGTAIHSFLQFTDFKSLEESFENEKNRLIKYGHITPKQGMAVKFEDIDSFMKSEIYKMIKESVNVIRERKFLISIEDLELNDVFGALYKGTDGMLNGIMDMVIENENSVILVDYKTDKVSNPSILATRYRQQLLLYKKSLEKTQSKPVISAMIYSFYHKTEVKVF